MKKNIVIIEDSSKAHFGGGQKVTLNVIEALNNEKFKIFLLDCNKESLFQQMAKKLNVQTNFNLKCFGKIKKGYKQSFSLGISEIIFWPFFLILNLFKLYKFTKQLNLSRDDTIIYAPHKKSLLLSFLFYKLFKFQYIFHAHTLDEKKSFFYSIMILPLKNALKIICVSNTVKDNIGLDNCITIYNPIKLNSYITAPKSLNKEKIVIATFSTLIPWKGIDFFIKSYDFKNSNVEYRVYGQGILYDTFKKFENNNIKIMGFCENILEEMKSLDIIVVPSIAKESFGMVSLEAFSHGIPVITTNIGGQSEIVIDSKVGFQVPIKNSKEINNKINFFIENPNVYKAFSQNALDYSKQFSYEIFKNKCINLFRDLK